MVVIQLSPPELQSLIENSLRNILKGDILQKTEVKPEKTILNIEEAVRITKLSKSRLYVLAGNGTIPNFKRGCRILFDKEELLKWLESGRRHSQHEIDAMADQSLKSA